MMGPPTSARLSGLSRPEKVIHITDVFCLSSTDPIHNVMDHAVHVYGTQIHLQPLPLFSLQVLPERLSQGPAYLRWAFLALCLNFTSPDCSPSEGPESVQHYSRLGHEEVVRLASNGTATLEILQALCLLALSDIKGRCPDFRKF